MPIIKVEQPIRLTRLEIRRLFTVQEKVALEKAVQEGNLVIKVFMDDLASASFISLNDPLFLEGVNYLELNGFLTEDRAELVRSGKIPNEVPGNQENPEVSEEPEISEEPVQ